MRLRGIGRIRKVLQRLRAAIAPGPTILLYHRVAELTADPQLLSVTPAHFEEHLAVLNKNYKVMPLDDLVTAVIKGAAPKKAVAITFDDGYADNYQHAWPLLKKYSMPATIYVATGYVASNREFFCDELERLLLRSDILPDALKLTIAGRQYEWQLRLTGGDYNQCNDSWSVLEEGDPTPAHQAYRELHRILRNQPYQIQMQALEEIRAAAGDDGSARPTHRALSWEQIREISAHGLVDIGAHTVNHTYLSSLTKANQKKEIVDSVHAIESWTQKRVTSFAYPYGTRDSYDANTLTAVCEAGFLNASSNFRARISKGTEPFQLPRLVVRDCPGDLFERRLQRNLL